MIFMLRQLMEKHGDPLFIMFIDLKKAYDSVKCSVDCSF